MRIRIPVVKRPGATAHNNRMLNDAIRTCLNPPQGWGRNHLSTSQGWLHQCHGHVHGRGQTLGHYREATSTKRFLIELSTDIGIPITDLVQSIKGGKPALQGTWVHPQVAIHLAQWLSPRFAVLVSRWVYDWMSCRAPETIRPLPYHIRRYVANQLNVPPGYFSILTELTQALIGPMEAMGYTLPEHMWPDVSGGRMFCHALRDYHGIDTDSLPTYIHVFEDGRPPVRAKAYPEELLPAFRRHFREEWLPKKAAEYFQKRDPRALQFLPRLLPAPKKKAS